MMDDHHAVEMRGTEGASASFFSPDGEWVAFFAGGKLKKTRLDGGEPVTLCDAAAGRGGSWGEDGNIVVARDSFAGLSRVPATGGEPAPLTELQPDELTHRWPQILPGGKAVLFCLNKTYANFGASSIAVLSLADGKRKVVLEHAGMYPRYLPSGHLTYVTKGALFAVPFDLHPLRVRGDPVQVAEEVSNDTTFGFAQLSYSTNGLLLYRKGRTQGLRTIHWLESGRGLEPLVKEPAVYQCLRISPDQNNLIWMMNQGPTADLWNRDLVRRTTIPLTDNKGVYTSPVWSPGGRFVVFNAKTGIYWTRADGAGKPQPLTPAGPHQYPSSFTADGRRLVFYRRTPNGGDISTVHLDGTPDQPQANSPELFLETKTALSFPAISPDGRWLAYGDIESGTYEVYVRAFPDVGKKWPISNNGGVMPFWSAKDNKLFYRTEDGQIMVTTYAVTGDGFQVDTPRLWSEADA
jgi:serine/threonine-protein kinase